MERLIDILQLPVTCLINRKITKAFFKRNFDLSLSERKLIEDDTILHIDWIASLKPVNCNIPSYSDEHCSYEEVQIIDMVISEDNFTKKSFQVTNLVQKHIPYHIFLCVSDSSTALFNVCAKRIHQNDVSRRTIERSVSTKEFSMASNEKVDVGFLQSLNYASLDKTNLKELYRSYTARIANFLTANVTGNFTHRSHERSLADLKHLDLMASKEIELRVLLEEAKSESQLNVQVQLNLEVQRCRREIALLKKMLINE